MKRVNFIYKVNFLKKWRFRCVYDFEEFTKCTNGINLMRAQNDQLLYSLSKKIRNYNFL